MKKQLNTYDFIKVLVENVENEHFPEHSMLFYENGKYEIIPADSFIAIGLNNEMFSASTPKDLKLFKEQIKKIEEYNKKNI